MIKCRKCKSEDFFFSEMRGPHMSAICAYCGSYIKHLPKEVKTDIKIPFGKYRGIVLSSLISKEEIRYLKWMVGLDDIKPTLKKSIEAHFNKQTHS